MWRVKCHGFSAVALCRGRWVTTDHSDGRFARFSVRRRPGLGLPLVHAVPFADGATATRLVGIQAVAGWTARVLLLRTSPCMETNSRLS